MLDVACRCPARHRAAAWQPPPQPAGQPRAPRAPQTPLEAAGVPAPAPTPAPPSPPLHVRFSVGAVEQQRCLQASGGTGRRGGHSGQHSSAVGHDAHSTANTPAAGRGGRVSTGPRLCGRYRGRPVHPRTTGGCQASADRVPRPPPPTAPNCPNSQAPPATPCQPARVKGKAIGRRTRGQAAAAEAEGAAADAAAPRWCT